MLVKPSPSKCPNKDSSEQQQGILEDFVKNCPTCNPKKEQLNGDNYRHKMQL